MSKSKGNVVDPFDVLIVLGQMLVDGIFILQVHHGFLQDFHLKM